jgi:NADPH-dependent curcumin reductase
MPQTTTINRRILLNSRPAGAPIADNFRMTEAPIPQPGSGQVVLRTLYLSLDHYMRGRMSDEASYAEPVALGEVMVGGTVSRVHASQHGDFKVGDLVQGYSGRQDQCCDTEITEQNESAASCVWQGANRSDT